MVNNTATSHDTIQIKTNIFPRYDICFPLKQVEYILYTLLTWQFRQYPAWYDMVFYVNLWSCCLNWLQTAIILYDNIFVSTLQWRHNGRESVSNHQPHDCHSTVYSDADQRKHQSSASLAFVQGIHRWPVNSPHKGPVTHLMTSSWTHIFALQA